MQAILQFGADRRVFGFVFKAAVQCTLPVQARPSHHDGQAPSVPDLLNDAPRGSSIRSRAVVFLGTEYIEQVMDALALLFSGWLGRADVHVAVYLPRVRRDDFHFWASAGLLRGLFLFCLWRWVR